MSDWLLVFMLVFFSAAILVGVLWSAGAIPAPEKETVMIDELVKQKVVSLWYAIRHRNLTGEHHIEVTDEHGHKHRITFIKDGEYFEMTSERIDNPTLQTNTLVTPPRED